MTATIPTTTNSVLIDARAGNVMPNSNFIQVGANVREGVVKLRAPDEKSPSGYVVQRLSPVAARALAEWLDDGASEKVLRISDGRRWAEHTLLSTTIPEIVRNLRQCADDVESAQART